MLRPLIPLLLSLAMLALPGRPRAAAPGLEDSVVRIVNFVQKRDWYSPWDVAQVTRSSGSGFVIEGGMVMTNAHVVSDSRLLLIQLHNSPEQHVAEVVHVAHDCDIALIRPKEPAALAGVRPLRFGGLPKLGSEVDTVGFPAGGTRISSTRGVVSRIEERLYVHSGKDIHLTGQTDAAINPGNSGGPVFQGSRVVGVAFQANLQLESVGFFIPTEVVNRFLVDIEDGRYDGYPELGATTSEMENPAARRHAGLAEEETGVRVDFIFDTSSADGYLETDDVILEVDGKVVASDGSVQAGDIRIPMGLLVDRLQVGDVLRARILRDGERMDLRIPLLPFTMSDTQGHLYDQAPRYFVYGGLVFVPLNREVMKTYGREWRANADKALLNEFMLRPVEEPAELAKESVVLLRRLKHAANADMAWYRNEVVDRVNGREIDSLQDLIAAIEEHDGDFHLLEFAYYNRIGVLDRQQAEAANREILERYGIERDRNP